jgi:hypothetical protein
MSRKNRKKKANTTPSQLPAKTEKANQKTIVQWIWSWGVVGPIILAICVGGGYSFMTSSHPYIADLFFLSGGILFLFKFLTWDISRKHGKRKLVEAVIIFITLLIIVGTICLNHYLNQEKSEEKRFSVTLMSSLIGGPYFAYVSDENLYFIDVFIYIDLVSKAAVFSKLHDYYAQLLVDDEWVPLQRILLSSSKGQFYSVYNNEHNIYNGTSIDFIQETLDEQILRTNIKPGETITGTLMFYLKENDRKKFIATKVRAIKLVVFDSLRRKEEYILNITKNQSRAKDEPDMESFNALGFKVKKMGIDLKKFHIINGY